MAIARALVRTAGSAACLVTVLALASVILLAGGPAVPAGAAGRAGSAGVLGLGPDRSAPPVAFRGSEKIDLPAQLSGAEDTAMRDVAQRREVRIDPPAPPKPARRAPVKTSRGASARAQTGEWKTATVSWYGPGFYGRRTASGTILRTDSMVVAHRTLPFGTRIEFEYKGRRCVAVVADRGPWIKAREFDLGPGIAQALGFGGVGKVKYRFVK